MPAEATILEVFIASPSDLGAERDALRRLEVSLNTAFSPANLGVRFTGWEEVPPGYGRPQARINPLVDRCDIFIGLLRRKWGTATGAHESGFLEEYERARARRERDGRAPEISLYFASMSQAEVDDAGPGLRKVLRFKRKIENDHIALYDSFATADDLATRVKDLLNRHLIDRMIHAGTSVTPEGAETGRLEEPEGPSNLDAETDHFGLFTMQGVVGVGIRRSPAAIGRCSW